MEQRMVLVMYYIEIELDMLPLELEGWIKRDPRV